MRSAVAYLHMRGVVHGRIAADNVLVAKPATGPHVLLTGFALVATPTDPTEGFAADLSALEALTARLALP